MPEVFGGTIAWPMPLCHQGANGWLTLPWCCPVGMMLYVDVLEKMFTDSDGMKYNSRALIWLLSVWGQEINSNIWDCLSPNFQNSAFYLISRNAREACGIRQIKNNRFRDREPN